MSSCHLRVGSWGSARKGSGTDAEDTLVIDGLASSLIRGIDLDCNGLEESSLLAEQSARGIAEGATWFKGVAEIIEGDWSLLLAIIGITDRSSSSSGTFAEGDESIIGGSGSK